MTLEALTERLHHFASSLDKKVPGASWYLFGSAIVSAQDANDYDVFIVCQTAQDADDLRHFIRNTAFDRPLHATIMTRDEGAELDFIDRYGAMEVFPRCTASERAWDVFNVHHS